MPFGCALLHVSTETEFSGRLLAPHVLPQSELLWFVAHRVGLVVIADGRFYKLLPVVWVVSAR